MLVGEALSRFYQSRKWGCRKSELKVQGYVARWSRRWGGLDVAELSVEKVKQLESERDDGIRSATALNYERGLLSRFFTFCRTLSSGLPEGLLDAWRPRRELIPTESYVFYSLQEKERISREIRADLKRFIYFAAVTGLREGSIRRVLWGWISQKGVLTVPAGAVKNKMPIRQALPEELLEMLGPRRPAMEPVFSEMPEWPQTVWKEFRKACRRAGVREGSPHDLRRSFAYGLMELDTPLPVICHLGGWSKPDILTRYYCGGLPDKRCRELLRQMMPRREP